MPSSTARSSSQHRTVDRNALWGRDRRPVAYAFYGMFRICPSRRRSTAITTSFTGVASPRRRAEGILYWDGTQLGRSTPATATGAPRRAFRHLPGNEKDFLLLTHTCPRARKAPARLQPARQRGRGLVRDHRFRVSPGPAVRGRVPVDFQTPPGAGLRHGCRPVRGRSAHICR